MKINDLNIKIFSDGADINDIRTEYSKGIVKGFTTNPTLMRKSGVADYMGYAKDILAVVSNLPVSFEVFSDDFYIMEKEAELLSGLGENVYVKIPVTNSRGEESLPLINRLSKKGIKVNVTAVFTLKQIKHVVDALEGADSIVSVFAGRIMDTGVDAEKIIREAKDICTKKENVELLWASCREAFNVIQAERSGADIITVTSDILKKIDCFGKDLEAYSLETVQMFANDAHVLGYSIMEEKYK